MNSTRRHSCSSSSDEVDSSHATVDLYEDHYAKCKYKIMRGTVAGSQVWIHCRVCMCGQRINRNNYKTLKKRMGSNITSHHRVNGVITTGATHTDCNDIASAKPLIILLQTDS
ncbi:hypothetical protein DPMN_136105 [Dreissena polymorpha]|uniref:Uncharacterized protein n=1 Tax=Dreissena polymorpha TaxID=45954 RepID=A0A9D4JHG8_DREPO|nr:hypothetical protein DPMN_136105 [Dreissena polymorpha]